MTSLGHSRTVDDADQLARVAARTHYSSALPVAEREDTARYAIVTALLEAATAPTDLELLHVGRDAISRAVADQARHRGLSARSPGQPAAGFVRYWAGRPEAWEEQLVDAIALGQIWTALPARFCRDLQALADHDGYAAAARALGTTDATFKVRISQARAAFRAWWHEHETPSAMWGSDRRTSTSRGRSVTHVIRARARDRRTEETIHAA